jgi:hypothetical protein
VSETTVYRRLYDLHRRCKEIGLHCTFVELLKKPVRVSSKKTTFFLKEEALRFLNSLSKAEVDIFYFDFCSASLRLFKNRRFLKGLRFASP